MSVRTGQLVIVPSELGDVLGEVVTVLPGAVVVAVEGTLTKVPAPQVRTIFGRRITRPLSTADFPAA